jgi:hypothetical protein
MDLKRAIDTTLLEFKHRSKIVRRERWQGLDVRTRPEMATHELLGHSVVAHLGASDLAYYKHQIRPDLPWADDHFAERVSGQPLNPPPSEAWWPHAPQGNQAFKTEGIFSHTYPERFWPKLANATTPRMGIRYPYGDLADVITLLRDEPYTRQAYLPIFHPEDTGNVMHERTPCTLGYHFLATGQSMDVYYYIRSCDLLRHFRNDIYFTVRLLLWVLDELRARDSFWIEVRPGLLRMHISSLHCFRNDFHKLFGEHK